MSARAARSKLPRPVFPFAVSLRAVAQVFEGDGRPALYVCVDDHGAQPHLYRVPDGCQIRVKAPHPLPDDGPRIFLPAGSAVVFETPTARTVLALHAVRVCRELLEAVEAHAHAGQTWKLARQTFEGPQAAPVSPR